MTWCLTHISICLLTSSFFFPFFSIFLSFCLSFFLSFFLSVCLSFFLFLSLSLLYPHDVDARVAVVRKQHVKRDLYIWKETCINEKRPNQETHVNDMYDMCDRRRNSFMISTYMWCGMWTVCQKRPVYMERDLILRPICKCDRRRISCMISSHVSPWYVNSMTKETCMNEKRPNKETVIGAFCFFSIWGCLG